MRKYFDDPSYDAAFERCVNLMTDMMVKYGPKVLQVQRQRLLDMFKYPDYCPVSDRELLLRRMLGYQEKYEHLKMAA